MMLKKRVYFICLSLVISCTVKAQVIYGDTINVNDQLLVTMAFPAEIFQAQLVDLDAPYTLSCSRNVIRIKAAVKNSKCSNAVIDEGKRSHVITLCYKTGLKPDRDDYYDLSTIKLLQKYAKESAERKKLSATTAANSSSGSPDSDKEKKNKIEQFLKEGKSAFKNNDLVAAQNNFKEALNLDPGNKTAQKGISDIEKSFKEQNENSIRRHKDAAKEAEERKDFKTALFRYNEVLKLDPRDAEASNKVAEIKKLQMAESKPEAVKKEEPQPTVATANPATALDKEKKIYYLKFGASKFFNEKNYTMALLSYKAALALNQYDSFSKNKIDEIQKILDQEKPKNKPGSGKKRAKA